jgi:hypothetical protein
VHRALLICNSTFPRDPSRLPDLYGPRVDGLYLWRELTNKTRGLFSTDSVAVLFERARSDVMDQAEELFGTATDRDHLLLYFSGHGIMAGDTLYLCARDTVASRPRTTAVSTDEIGKMITDSRAASVSIILDCCFAGSFKGRKEPSLGGRGRYVISATTELEQAPDSEENGSPSPFTEALIASLAYGATDHDGDEKIGLRDVYIDLETRIGAGPAVKQDFDGTGQPLIARRPAPPAEVTAPETVAAAALEARATLAAVRLTMRDSHDISRGDLRSWVVTALLGAVVAVTAYLSFAATMAWDTAPPGALLVSYALAGATGVGLLVMAPSEAFIQRRAARASTRRVVVGALYESPARLIQTMKTICLVPALVSLATAAGGVGWAYPSWVVCCAAEAAAILMTACQLARVRDSVLFAAGALLFGGNFVPMYFRNTETEPGFHSGLDTWHGWFALFAGAALLAGWWRRVPRQTLGVVLALLALVTVAGAAQFAITPNPHAYLRATCLVMLALALALGAGVPVGPRNADTGSVQ